MYPFKKDVAKHTNLKCPISGDTLWVEPVKKFVMDPSRFYYAENHPQYRYERHPFSWNLFKRVHGGSRTMGCPSIAYYHLNKDNSWKELFETNGLDDLVEAGTSQEEITYPYTVTEENIEETKKNWDFKRYAKYGEHDEIQGGDVIDKWKHGEPLSMRMGEMIVRNGIEIYSHLTSMS